MRGGMRLWIVCAGFAVAGTAVAAPRPRPCANLAEAAKNVEKEDHEQAIAMVDECLAVQPNNLAALLTKGLALKGLRDYKGAEAAYRAYVAAAPRGANRYRIEELADDMKIAQSTFLAITVTNGPATIYLDVEAPPVFCTAAPSCKQMALPRSYTVIARRPGFERWSQRVAVGAATTTPLAVTLVEKPSMVTLRAAPSGAQITVDSTRYTSPTSLPAGRHRATVTLAGHRSVEREIDAREGKPVELEITLTPIVPVQLQPATTTLLLDGKPVAVEGGDIAVEPGNHELTARASGFTEQRVAIPEARPADYRIAISLARMAEPPGEPGMFTRRRKVAAAAGGLAVAASAAGALLGLSSRSLDHDSFGRCPSPSTPCPAAAEANDLNKRARARAVQANVAFGVAGAAAVAGAILWFTGAPESRVAVLPRVGPVAGLDLTASF